MYSHGNEKLKTKTKQRTQNPTPFSQRFHPCIYGISVWVLTHDSRNPRNPKQTHTCDPGGFGEMRASHDIRVRAESGWLGRESKPKTRCSYPGRPPGRRRSNPTPPTWQLDTTTATRTPWQRVRNTWPSDRLSDGRHRITLQNTTFADTMHAGATPGATF